MATENNKTEKELDTLVGARLKALRIANGLSQTELGKQAGISFQQIQKCEKGSNRIGAGRLWMFCNILGVEAGNFFDYEPEEMLNVADDYINQPDEWSKMLSRSNYKLLSDFEKIENPAYKSSVVRICEGLAKEAKSSQK